jgi:nucleoside-diphosphate-sugar epimerase
MRCLVTGASGFVGSHLVDALVARGDEVTALVRRTSNRRWLEHGAVRCTLGSFDDPASLEDAVRGQDAVFHIAGVITALTRRDYFRTNVDGTRRLVEACRRAAPGLKRFLHVSSLAACGPARGIPAVDETTPCHPVSPYGESKLGGERAAMAASPDLPVTAVRPPVVVGPRDSALLPFFRVAKHGLRPILGERKHLSLVYVSDLVAGILLAASAPRAAGQVYFVTGRGWHDYDALSLAMARASGVRRTVRLRVPMSALSVAALAMETIAPLTGNTPMLTGFKIREISQQRWTCTAAKAEQELGFAPRVGLDEAMEHTARWYRDEGLL